jgi:hypothetical protein
MCDQFGITKPRLNRNCESTIGRAQTMAQLYTAPLRPIPPTAEEAWQVLYGEPQTRFDYEIVDRMGAEFYREVCRAGGARRRADVYQLESQAVATEDAAELILQVLRNQIANSLKVSIPRWMSSTGLRGC